MRDWQISLAVKVLRRLARMVWACYKVMTGPTRFLWQLHCSLNKQAHKVLRKRGEFNQTKHPATHNPRL